MESESFWRDSWPFNRKISTFCLGTHDNIGGPTLLTRIEHLPCTHRKPVQVRNSSYSKDQIPRDDQSEGKLRKQKERACLAEIADEFPTCCFSILVSYGRNCVRQI